MSMTLSVYLRLSKMPFGFIITSILNILTYISLWRKKRIIANFPNYANPRCSILDKKDRFASDEQQSLNHFIVDKFCTFNRYSAKERVIMVLLFNTLITKLFEEKMSSTSLLIFLKAYM